MWLWEAVEAAVAVTMITAASAVANESQDEHHGSEQKNTRR